MFLKRIYAFYDVVYFSKKHNGVINMVAPVDNTATLKSLVSVANSKIEPKILTDRNFKLLSIKPLRSTTSPHNTVASVQVDLAGDSPIAIVSSDRYSRRLVEFTRIDLKDIANFRAIPKNEKGQYIGEITDAASVLTLLNAAIEEDELVLIKTADATVVKAAEDSLGYVGAILLLVQLVNLKKSQKKSHLLF